MPITNDPTELQPDPSVGVQPTVKQQQEGANALEAAASPEQGTLEVPALQQRQTPQAVPFSGFEDEDDELLYGPTDRPNDLMRNTGRTAGTAPIPQGLIQRIPALLEAAKQPDAPPELHAFIRILAFHLGQEFS